MKKLLPLTLIFLSGCITSTLPDLSGKYTGNLSNQSEAESIAAIISKPQELSEALFSEIELTKSSSEKIKIILKHNGESAPHSLWLKFPAQNEIELIIHGACADADQEKNRLELCWTKETVSITEKSKSGQTIFALELHKNDGMPNFGDGSRSLSISLEESILKIRSGGRKEAQEVEKLYRARNNIQIAQRNLLPHVSGRSVISMILFPQTGFGLAETIINLVPFIWPTNWYKVEQAKYAAASAEASYTSLVANEINIIETLYYNIARDQALLKLSEQFIARAKLYESTVEELGRIGIERSDAAIEIKDIIRAHENDTANLRSLLKIELTQYASALSIYPLSSIQSVKEISLPNLNNMKGIQASDFLFEAKIKSPELETLRNIIRSIGEESKSLNYSYINPQDFISIDFSMKPKENNILSTIREAQAQVDQQLSSLDENATDLSNKHNFLLQSNARLESERMQKAQELVQLNKLAETKEIRIRQIFYAERNIFESEFKKLNNSYTYLIIKAKIERMKMSGVYKIHSSEINLK